MLLHVVLLHLQTFSLWCSGAGQPGQIGHDWKVTQDGGMVGGQGINVQSRWPICHKMSQDVGQFSHPWAGLNSQTGFGRCSGSQVLMVKFSSAGIHQIKSQRAGCKWCFPGVGWLGEFCVWCVRSACWMCVVRVICLLDVCEMSQDVSRSWAFCVVKTGCKCGVSLGVSSPPIACQM